MWLCSVNFLSDLTQLLNLCEAEDAALMKLPCYKSLPSLVPLRIAALSTCYFFIHIYKELYKLCFKTWLAALLFYAYTDCCLLWQNRN